LFGLFCFLIFLLCIFKQILIFDAMICVYKRLEKPKLIFFSFFCEELLVFVHVSIIAKVSEQEECGEGREN